MLDSARELFAEFGYASTTVRMIADKAGLSVGGVFTTFEDKADILHHVRMGQSAALREAMAAAAPLLSGTTAQRASALLAMAYEKEWPFLAQVVAYIGASYGWSGTTEQAMKTDHAPVWGALKTLIEEGRARGELRGDVDAELAVEVIYGIYLGQYRRAWYGGWSATQASTHLERKLMMIFAGMEANPRTNGEPA